MTQDNMDLRLAAMQAADEEAWEALCSHSSFASIYHTHQWRKVLASSFGFKAQYITAYLNDELVDGLPLFLVKMPILGEKLVSIPHCGGHPIFLADDYSVHKQLLEFAIDEAQKRHVAYLELRHCENLHMPVLEARQPVIFPVVPLLGVDENFALLSENHRRSIRRANKQQVSVYAARDYQHLRDFYQIMAAQSQRFGSPMFPFKYFDALWQEFKPGRMFELLMIKHNGKVVGGGIFFIYKHQIMYKYGACDQASLGLRPFHAMIWQAIQMGLERGLTEMDLGAASIGDEGLLRFKRHWGADMRPAFFHYLEVTQSVPNVEDYFESYGWQKAVWRRLPRKIVNLVGPKVLQWVC